MYTKFKQAQELGNRVVVFLQNKKTYLVGTAMALQGLSGLLNELTTMQDWHSIVTLAMSGSSDPAMQMFLMGCAILTGRAALAKVQAQTPPQA